MKYIIKSYYFLKIELNKFINLFIYIYKMDSVKNKYGKKTKVLGEGAFGKVYATDVPGIAIKISKYDEDEGLSDSFIKEVSIINLLNDIGYNNNITQIRDTYIIKEESKTALVLPLAESEFEITSKISDIRKRKIIMYQIIRGIAYMNSKHVMHYDLKPGNILQFEDGSLKISDYGISTFAINESYRQDNYVYTVFWRPIEILLGVLKNSKTCDVWAAAVILIQMLVGEQYINSLKKYSKNYEENMIKHILDILGTPSETECPNYDQMMDKLKIEKMEYTPKRLDKLYEIEDKDELDFLKNTYTWATKRLTSMEALNHPYFDSVRDDLERAYPSDKIVETRCDDVLQKIDGIYDINFDGDVSEKNMLILYNWMYEVFKKFKLRGKTYLLSLLYVRKYMKIHKVPRKKLQLVAVAAMVLAGRIIQTQEPEIADYSWITGKAFSKEEIKDMVIDMFESFNYRAIIATCFDYIVDEDHKTQIPKEYSDAVFYMSILLNVMPEIYNNYTQREMAATIMQSLGINNTCYDISPINFNDRFFDNFDKSIEKLEHLKFCRDSVKKLYNF
jgi:serine/threonine protein kinase